MNELTIVFPVSWLVLVGLYGALAPTQVFELPIGNVEIIQPKPSSMKTYPYQ